MGLAAVLCSTVCVCPGRCGALEQPSVVVSVSYSCSLSSVVLWYSSFSSVHHTPVGPGLKMFRLLKDYSWRSVKLSKYCTLWSRLTPRFKLINRICWIRYIRQCFICVENIIWREVTENFIHENHRPFDFGQNAGRMSRYIHLLFVNHCNIHIFANIRGWSPLWVSLALTQLSK